MVEAVTYTVSIFMFCRSPSIAGSNYSNGMVRQMIRLSNYQTIVPKGYALKSVSITKKSDPYCYRAGATIK